LPVNVSSMQRRRNTENLLRPRVKVRLIAKADEGTEMFVIDGDFRRVTSGLNRLETDLPPGLYTVKFKRGNVLAEVDADLLPGSNPVEVQAPKSELAFYSAAPMEQTITSHQDHEAAAIRISRMDPLPISRGRGGFCLSSFVMSVLRELATRLSK
jgi:hypothetical protein